MAFSLPLELVLRVDSTSMSHSRAGDLGWSSFGVALLFLFLINAAMADSSINSSKASFGFEKHAYSETQATAAAETTIFLTSTTNILHGAAWQAQTAPTRTFALDASSGVSVAYIYSLELMQALTLSNGTAYLPRSLLAGAGFFPAITPISLTDFNWGHVPLERLRLDGLPYPNGFDFSSAAYSKPAPATFPLLRKSAVNNYGSLYLYDNGDLYFAQRPTVTALTYMDSLHLAKVDDHPYYTARVVNSDPGFLRDNGGIPPPVLRLESVNFVCMYALTSNGRLYSTNCHSGADVNVGSLSIPFNRTIDGLPSMTVDEINRAGNLPFICTGPGGINMIYLSGSLYVWGTSHFGLVNADFYTALKVDLSTILPTTANPTNAPANITHMATTFAYSVLVVADGSVFVVTSASDQNFNPALTSLIQSQAPGNSSSLIDLTSAPSKPELVLLMADGTVWTYMFFTSPSDKPFVINIIDATMHGPWKSDLSPYLPAGFKIKRLIQDPLAYSFGFLATSSSQATAPAEIIQPPAQSQRLFSPDPSTLVTPLKWDAEGSNLDTFKTYKELELNQFSQIAVGGLQILALTTNGSLLTSATSVTEILPVKRDSSDFGREASDYVPASGDFRSTPVYRPSTKADMPFHVDPKVFGGKSIVQIAAGSYDAIALLDDGTVALWGADIVPYTFARPAVPSPPSAPPSSSPISFQEADPYTGNNLGYFSTPAGFASVHAMDFWFLLRDNEGRLFSLGGPDVTSTDYDTLFTHDTIPASFGIVTKLSISRTSPLEFWLVCGNSTSALQSVRCSTTLPIFSVADARFRCISSGNANFAYDKVRAIASGSGYMVLLSDDGIYGIGNNAEWFNENGATGTYAQPYPLTFPGLLAPSLIKSIHIYQDTLQVLAYNGSMYSSCAPDMFARCSGRSMQIRQILPRHNVTVVSRSGISAPAPRIFAADSATFNKQETREPDFFNIVFGASAANVGWGGSPLNGTDGRIFVLPPGNPLETSSVTNIRMSQVLGFDYQLSSTANLFLLWTSFAGDQQTASNVLPFPSPYQPSNDLTVVSTAMVAAGFISIHQNCSATLFVPTSFDPDFVYFNTSTNSVSHAGFDPSQASTSTTPGPAPGFYMPTSRPLHTYQLDSASDLCVQNGSPIVVAYCDRLGEFYVSTGGYNTDNNFYCMMVAADGSLWARGSTTDPLSYDGCSGAMLGESTSCQSNTANHNVASNSFQVSTNKLPTPDMTVTAINIASASIAKKHVMVLFTDGSVAVYGNNWRGQLGRSPSTMDSSTKLIAMDLSIINNASSQVLAMGRTSFALTNNRTQIVSWGCNMQGQLGRATSSTSDADAYDATPGLVVLPTHLGLIMDFECTELSCYVLFDYGQVYSWGYANHLALGRRVPATAFYDPIPARARLLEFPTGGASQPRVIKDLIASKHTSLVVARLSVGNVIEHDPPGTPMTVPPPPTPPTTPIAPPSPTPASCAMNTRPSEQFICQNGAWISNATVTAPVLTIPAGATQTIVNGSLESSQLIFQGLGSTVTVTGCANNLSRVSLEISAEELKKIGSKGLRQTLLTYSGSDDSCNNLDIVQLNSAVKGSSCRDLKVEKTTSNGQLSALFTVNSSRCNTWWIILASVLAGAVVIFCIVMVLLVLFVPSVRECLRPYSKRNRGRAYTTE